MTFTVPDEDRYHHGLDYFKAQLVMLMGGRAADRLVYGQAYVRGRDGPEAGDARWPATWSRSGA